MAFQRKSKVVFKFHGVRDQAIRLGRSDDFRKDGEAEKGMYMVRDNDQFSVIGASGGFGDISFAMEPRDVNNDLYIVVNNPTIGQQTVRAYKGNSDDYDKREMDYDQTTVFEGNGWRYSFYRYSKNDYDNDDYATLTLTISRI